MEGSGLVAFRYIRGFIVVGKGAILRHSGVQRFESHIRRWSMKVSALREPVVYGSEGVPICVRRQASLAVGLPLLRS